MATRAGTSGFVSPLHFRRGETKQIGYGHRDRERRPAQTCVTSLAGSTCTAAAGASLGMRMT
jgi:hypothetical protein